MSMTLVGMIPARLGSTRFPEKVLRLICGRPMIEHVWNRARQARSLSDVWIVCDDERVLEAAKKFGAKALLTRPDHPNGTSRIAEAAERIQADVFVNIQGDEPLMNPANIEAVAALLSANPGVQVSTAAVRRRDAEGYRNPNVVKVVCDEKGRALYFSRASLPFCRDGGDISYLKHLGLYAYRRDFLLEFVKWPASSLETVEKLEQLRMLERGIEIRVVETGADSPGVDTPEDLALVEKLMTQEGKA